jgi:hypothetical protein
MALLSRSSRQSSGTQDLARDSGDRRRAVMGLPGLRGNIALAILLALFFTFALQVFSPLRLNTDVVTILSMGESAAEGQGFLHNGQKTVFPPGYPALLAFLLKIGLAHSWTIVGLNVILLAVGTYSACRVLEQDLLKDKVSALYLCSFFLLSFIVVKHLTFALSDIAFLSSAFCCLALLGLASVVTWGGRFATLLAASWIFMVGSISIRRVGIALIPAFLYAALSRSEIKVFLRKAPTHARLLVGLTCACACALTIYVIESTSTLSDFSNVAAKSSWSGIAEKIVFFRLSELGELMLNVSVSKLPRMVHGIVPLIGIVQLILFLCGLLLLALTFAGLIGTVKKRERVGPADLFLVSYIGVLFAWPFNDARFWLPVLPLLAGYSHTSVLRAMKLGLPRVLTVTYISVFAILGVAAIGYSTLITFAGPKFPDLYVDGALRPTYCAAFQTCVDGFDKRAVDPEGLHLLQTFH